MTTTFFSHGLIGSGLCALPFIWTRRLWIRIAAAVFGFLGGIAPDAVDWVAAFLGLAPRWELYSRMHTGDLVPYFIWHPGYFLHLEVDSTIHKWPGYDWWNEYYMGEIMLWVIGIGLLYFVFRREISTIRFVNRLKG